MQVTAARQDCENEYLTSRQLAGKLAMSVKWIEKHRRRIAGACRFGRAWRFNRITVEKALLTGRLMID